MVRKRWVLHKAVVEHREIATSLAEEHNLPPLAAMLALGRGISEEELPGFLGLEDEPLVNPYDLPDMEAAAQRIEVALEQGEHITVFGDYDADGVTATALLYKYLSRRTEQVSYHVPDRQTEGYGLTMGAIDKLAERGTKLIVTVDNGTSALREIEYAKALGMDTVVTDHHQVGDALPNAIAVVNPHRKDCDLPFKDYTGVAVAFLLVCALEGCEPEELLPVFAPLVALGTIADVAPLLGDNRVFAREGLQQLNTALGIVFSALLRVANATRTPYGTSAFSFVIGPRINAAGRMGLANEAVELLLCEDEAQAARLAQTLDQYNQERQQMEHEILAQAIAWLEANPKRQHDHVLVFAGEGWHEGVVGIVASRLVERYGKPCLVITQNDENAKGSGRSLPGFHLFDALHSCAHLMQKYGGHELAAGFSLPTCEVARLREKINAYAAKHGMPFPLQQLDAKLKAARLSPELADELALLKPFGQGNPQPVFALTRMVLLAATPVSEGRHLRLTLEQDDARVTVMAFRTTVKDFDFVPGDLLDLAVTLEANEYMGKRGLSLILRRAKFSLLPNEALLNAERLVEQVKRRETIEQAVALLPAREDGAKVFRMLQKQSAPVPPERLFLLAGLHEAKAEQLARLWLAAEVLRELGIAGADGAGRYSLAPPGEKMDWETAALVQFLKQ